MLQCFPYSFIHNDFRIIAEMKLLLKIFTILIFGIAFNARASFALQKQTVVKSNQKQEVKILEATGTHAALLEHSRVQSPVHSESLPISAPVLFTFISLISFASFTQNNSYQKKLKMLRQRWLWLILFPFHTFY